MNYDTAVKEIEEVAVLEKEITPSTLFLFNDDFNTFEHVIECLIQICGHTQEQAHQCSLFVHYKGKCDVKTGEFKNLKKQCSQLLERGLFAKVI